MRNARDAMEPVPENRLDEVTTKLTGGPEKAHYTLSAISMVLIAAGVGCLLFVLWYAPSGGTATALAVAGVIAIAGGMVVATGIRRRRGEVTHTDVFARGVAQQRRQAQTRETVDHH